MTKIDIVNPPLGQAKLGGRDADLYNEDNSKCCWRDFAEATIEAELSGRSSN
ncbi:hypothetical protein J4G43_026885 [Bradyrhizobium barranii subsp. barranii]|uniref:Uncharacterized protein n=1 Tax=Bradyrhizobium barranii subsp. barranii TaxID=2823807 RepID=A0A939M8Z7_9BRAD|nr:hypothetical protein [Bradyrhizobium barranii]UEM08421.1 hypothetical protein J4G43_026885 [Bradyrhizobium barranii subsp. barranii]